MDATRTEVGPPYGRMLRVSDGYDLHLREEGTGPAVVFVHGSGPGVNAHSNFFPNYPAIAAAGYRVLLPDLIGYGYSSKPTGIDYTLELFTNTLTELLDAVGVRDCVLIGNSLGGAVALQIAMEQPERVKSWCYWDPEDWNRAKTISKCRASRRWSPVLSAPDSTGMACGGCWSCSPSIRSLSPRNWSMSA